MTEASNTTDPAASTGSGATKDYWVSQKIIHWVMACLVIGNLMWAQKFGDTLKDAERFATRNDHAQIGILIGLLLVARFYLRIKNGAPGFPAEMPSWQKETARIAHWALYGVMAVLIVTGGLTAMNADSIISPFGLFAYGDGSGGGNDFAQMRGLHTLAIKALYALIALHLGAAFYHLSIAGDGVGLRMFSFSKTEAPD